MSLKNGGIVKSSNPIILFLLLDSGFSSKDIKFSEDNSTLVSNIDKLLFKDQYSTLKKQAGVLSYSSIDDKINAIETAKTRIDVNANFDVTMELLLLTLKEK